MKTNLRFVFIPFILLSVLLSGCCLDKTSAVECNPLITRFEENTLLIDDSISLTFPEGFSCSDSGDLTCSFIQNKRVVGGVRKYPNDDHAFPAELFDLMMNRDEKTSPQEWLAEFGIPEAGKPYNADMIELYGNVCSAWFRSEEAEISHNLVGYQSSVYDIWFDNAILDPYVDDDIFETLTYLEN